MPSHYWRVDVQAFRHSTQRLVDSTTKVGTYTAAAAMGRDALLDDDIIVTALTITFVPPIEGGPVAD